MHSPFAASVLVSFLLLPSALALSGHSNARPREHRHRGSAVQEREVIALNLTERAFALSKRDEFDNARFTFFDSGTGNCGSTFTDDDFVIALNTPQYADGAHCFKPVTLTFEGKTVHATVADRCIECPYGAIDLTRGLFRALVAPGRDQVYGSWSFGNGDDPATTTSVKTTSTPPPPPPTTTTSSTPKPTPTTTSTTSTTTTSKTTTSTSSTSKTSSTSSTRSSTTTSSSSSSSSTLTSTSSTSSTAQSSASATSTASSLLGDLNQAYLQLGNLIAVHAAN